MYCMNRALIAILFCVGVVPVAYSAEQEKQRTAQKSLYTSDLYGTRCIELEKDAAKRECSKDETVYAIMVGMIRSDRNIASYYERSRNPLYLPIIQTLRQCARSLTAEIEQTAFEQFDRYEELEADEHK